jgi:hypothetical protein
MSHDSVPDPTAFERGNYMKVLSSYTLRANVFNDEWRFKVLEPSPDFLKCR